MYLLNSFSAGMLAEMPANVKFTEITAAEAAERLAIAETRYGWTSAVGHTDTATLFEAELNAHLRPTQALDVPCNRINLKLHSGSRAVLGQYAGPRLAEGTTVLPAGVTIRWLLISVG